MRKFTLVGHDKPTKKLKDMTRGEFGIVIDDSVGNQKPLVYCSYDGNYEILAGWGDGTDRWNKSDGGNVDVEILKSGTKIEIVV